MGNAWYRSGQVSGCRFPKPVIALVIAGYVLCVLSGCVSENLAENNTVNPLKYEDIQKTLERDAKAGLIYSKDENIEASEAVIHTVSVCREEIMHQPVYFAYDSLTESEQIWYRDINQILANMQENQELSVEGLDVGLTEECIDKIFQCVLNDHPEYFFVDGYTYTWFTRWDQVVKLEFSGAYSISATEAAKRSEEIEKAVTEIINGIAEGASDYEKVKYVYETLICNTEYDMSAPDNQNIYSVFVNNRSVCQGYAKAAQYLLTRLGVECTLVVGTVENGDGHVWNLVKIDDNYYHVDVTWGDVSYLMDNNWKAAQGSEEMYLPKISYDYLCVNTEQLLKTHVVGGVVPIPVCDSLEYNYFVQEGLYFTQVDQKKLAEVFAGAVAAGKVNITLKCSDSMVYEEMNRLLIEEQGIFEYFDNADDQIAFAQNSSQLSVTFWGYEQ